MAEGRVVGIDLGTTNSLVAYMEGDKPVVIPGVDGSNLVPSVVALDPMPADGQQTDGYGGQQRATRADRDAGAGDLFREAVDGTRARGSAERAEAVSVSSC